MSVFSFVLSEFGYVEISKLTDDLESWSVWKIKIKAILVCIDCVEIVEGECTRPEKPSPEQEKWDRLQSSAYLHLLFSIHDDFLGVLLLGDIDSEGNRAQRLWKVIHNHFKARSKYDKPEVCKKLMTIKLSDGGDLGEHLRELLHLRDLGSAVGYEMTDKEFCERILLSLPQSWNSAVDAMFWKAKHTTPFKIMETLRDIESFRECRRVARETLPRGKSKPKRKTTSLQSLQA